DNFNAWMPDPQEPLPQWIELAWNKPQTLNMVHVTFLTASRAPARFALLAWHNDNWTTLAERADTRFRRHLIGFEPTTTQRIRLVLLSARSREMGVCEIRAYLEPARLVEIADRAWHNVNLPDGGPGFPWPDAQLELVGIAPAKLPGAVIDDTNAVLIGKWSASGSIQPFVLAGYLHDGNSDKGARSATFIPNLARAGTYEIRFAYTASGNRATNVPVMIRTSRGSQTVRINQRKKPPIDGLFVSLGSFYLDAGSSTEIVVSNEGTDGYVVVDALQFIEK
ncbi:hypothetical protein FJY63_02525, partial [Candidatus Sumerlaeota bacterium]|nr:hypothetical protein [Candidatus Sumerlaeota bacterium]